MFPFLYTHTSMYIFGILSAHDVCVCPNHDECMIMRALDNDNDK